MPRDKNIKLSTDSYETLEGLVGHKRKRAQALENLIKVLEKASKEDKAFMVHILEHPDAIKLSFDKKYRSEES